MSKVLVTGGLGFIGQRLIARLQESDVYVVDNLHPQVHGQLPSTNLPTNERIKFLRSEVEAPDTWTFLDDWAPDVVIHLAAETGTGQSLSNSVSHARVNAVGLCATLDALSHRSIFPQSAILTSSRAVYGEGYWQDSEGRSGPALARSAAMLARAQYTPRLASGTTATVPSPHNASKVPPSPTNVYAATKLAQEHILKAWCDGFGVRSRVLRLQNVYGPGQSLSNPYTGVLTHFAKLALANEAIPIFEQGGIVRDFVHVEDVVDALCLALGSESFEGVVDVGCGEPTTLESVAELLLELVGSRGHLVFTSSYRPGDVRAAYADTDAAARILGYRPRRSLEAGLADLLAWADS